MGKYLEIYYKKRQPFRTAFKTISLKMHYFVGIAILVIASQVALQAL